MNVQAPRPDDKASGGQDPKGGDRREAPAAPPPPASAPGEDLDALRRKAAERDDFHDKMLRALADYQNLVRRIDRERADIEMERTRSVAGAFLTGLDDLARLLSAPAGNEQALRDGVRIVLKAIRKALQTCGIEEIPAEGRMFDPQAHEAVGREARADVAPGTVTAVVAAGYRYRGRLLRPARVVLAEAPPTAQAPSPAVARNKDENAAETRKTESTGETHADLRL